MLRVGLSVAAFCTACFSTPGFHGTSGADGGGSGSDGGVDSMRDAPPDCTWSTPQVLNGAFSGEVSGQPTMNAAMTLMMWDYGPSGMTNDLRWAERSPTAGTWQVHQSEPFDTGNNTIDLDPTLNDAGDIVFYLSNASGSTQLYEARFENGQWQMPVVVVPEASITGTVGIDAIGDGNTLYIAFGGGDLRKLHRPDKNSAFARSDVVGTHALFPGISPDEMDVYQAIQGGEGLDHYVRSSPQGVFGSTPAEHLFGSDEVTDAEILADGVHMIVAMNRVTVGMSTCQ